MDKIIDIVFVVLVLAGPSIGLAALAVVVWRMRETIRRLDYQNETAITGLGMLMKSPVFLCRLRPSAKIPKYAHQGDSGIDICADESILLMPGSWYKVSTGISAILMPGFELQVRPRSGMAARDGVATIFGTIDSGYRGEIGVTLVNYSAQAYQVNAGDRIAQLVLAPVTSAEVHEFTGDPEKLKPTERGTDGFGSSGR